jgi:hypothetical protein
VNANPLLRARRRPLWLGVLAVAVFGLRALLPTGYMLATVEGHARLILCPAGVHHAEHAATGAEHCPFALSGGASLASANPDPAKPYYSSVQPAPAPVVESVPAAPPPRFHAPRGPPSPA